MFLIITTDHKMRKVVIGLLCLLLLCSTISQAQDQEKVTIPLDHFYAKRKKRVLRSILTRITLGISTGYGNTFLDHKLNGFAVHQATTGGPEISSNKSTTRYRNWVNQLEKSERTTQSDDFLLNSDTATLAFTGNALNIPLNITLHYEFRRYRFGVGYAYEYMEIGNLTPVKSYGGKIRSFRPSGYTASISKYFALLGVSFYRWQNILFTGDVNVGGLMLGSNFGHSMTNVGIYANLGITVEYQFSEYLKAFIRPAFEFKNYTLSLPEQGGTIQHNINAVYIGVGFSYRLPKLPRCFHPECFVQIDHVHGNKEYGSRAHSIFKKQNPHYGENYRMPKKDKEKYHRPRKKKKR